MNTEARAPLDATTDPSELPPALGPDDPAYRVFIDSLDYLSAADLARVEEAFVFSERCHRGQRRNSGEPYITHPLAVAGALAEWKMDAVAVMAALLHDTIEDTGATKEQLIERFGKPVADLVEGLSKLDKLEFASLHEAQAENFRKMLLAMARDIRVILIKLTDRLHNMQTLGGMRPDKRRRIARETLEIYAPIANRLGLNTLFRELQDLAFKSIYPHRYEVLERTVKSVRGNRKEMVQKILSSLTEKLLSSGVKAEVFGRQKTLYSIYRKMIEKHLSFSQVLDIYGFRVVVESDADCYLALGALHALYKPLPGKFKDYIAIPKVNGYQSLHTTLIGPYGTPIEIQIRTRDQHRLAQEGVASHWLYKESGRFSDDLHDKTAKWLESLVEMQSMSGDSSEFYEHAKVDLFPDEVFVFTPKGKILTLPKGSTAVDFAYAVHTDIGNRCVAARINRDFAPLRTELQNGDQVEIITAVIPNPNPAWLKFVRSGRTRSKIRHFLRSAHHESSAALGKRLLSSELARYGQRLQDVPQAEWGRVLSGSGAQAEGQILSQIGMGHRPVTDVAVELLGLDPALALPTAASPPVMINGAEGVAVHLSSCCQPIPGDPIVGSLDSNRGLIVHTHDCLRIRRQLGHDAQKWVDVEWAPEINGEFDVRIRVEIRNQRGVLAKISAAIAEADSNIVHISMDDVGGMYTTLYFTLQVRDRKHLAKVMRNVRHLPEVSRITRIRDSEERTA
jgi:GTP pyrophosphokinase/guanosine-3',5'-bis(diphosphate) 3'-pyrophosphohydrolase